MTSSCRRFTQPAHVASRNCSGKIHPEGCTNLDFVTGPNGPDGTLSEG
jgi:hypothetical protein